MEKITTNDGEQIKKRNCGYCGCTLRMDVSDFIVHLQMCEIKRCDDWYGKENKNGMH